MNLSLARVYLNGADPTLGMRTWQDVVESIVSQRKDETRRRWDVAIKDKNFDGIRKLTVAETRPEQFYKALEDGKVSTNVYLRRIYWAWNGCSSRSFRGCNGRSRCSNRSVPSPLTCIPKTGQERLEEFDRCGPEKEKGPTMKASDTATSRSSMH